jgi:hypothetical protein
MGKVHLLVHVREASSYLVDRKEGGLTLELGFVSWQIEQDWVICLRYCMSPGDRESDWWRKV